VAVTVVPEPEWWWQAGRGDGDGDESEADAKDGDGSDEYSTVACSHPIIIILMQVLLQKSQKPSTSLGLAEKLTFDIRHCYKNRPSTEKTGVCGVVSVVGENV